MKEEKLVSQEEILRQKEYMRDIRARNAGRPLHALVDTYGCQQNEADSEILRGMLLEMGYAMTEREDEADVVVINTCAVREHAEMRVLGNVGALVHTKRRRPGQIIAICGCMAQQAHMVEKIKNSYHHVDLVFGTHALYRFPELLLRVMTTKKRVFELVDTDGRIFEGMPVYRENQVKAWVSIMYGCNNFCSYCIVPYVRGRERSRAPQMILDEISGLIAQGARDITLLGQNVNSYGRDLDEEVDFAALLAQINALPGEFKIRFMTSHPKDATPRLFETMARCEKVAHHIHLPFQSGSDRILKAMNRGYTQEQSVALTRAARALMPDISFTSDVSSASRAKRRRILKRRLRSCGALDSTRCLRFYIPRVRARRRRSLRTRRSATKSRSGLSACSTRRARSPRSTRRPWSERLRAFWSSRTKGATG